MQTSCGYGVPLFDYKEERPTLLRWAENKGEDGIAAYWHEKNIRSIDGFDTGLTPPIPVTTMGDSAPPVIARSASDAAIPAPPVQAGAKTQTAA